MVCGLDHSLVLSPSIIYRMSVAPSSAPLSGGMREDDSLVPRLSPLCTCNYHE